MIIRLDTQIIWSASRDPETDGWVGVCEALKVTAYGDTWDELSASVADIQESLFTELLQEGTLDAFLRELGWQPVVPIPAAVSDREPVQFDIPTQILTVPNNNNNNPRAAHA